ncbi:metallophosphoesterase [Psychrobacter sp. DAB_AL62B]|uniref:metallophosphoesterase n=1 Tax=Psychrobacter sp. DAB_AL62B TaxID=1028420 RepID=UPI0023811C21|nr:metallophosphoesterase [Psychrobacter sp. DAB_AL62B]MDE4455810.1 metallophosphoesterase [Psychrobacter sp. DAB_AL62B]
MWLFILITQLLAIMSSIVFYWLIQPKQSFGKVLLVLSAFLINNLFLIYGLSEFWHERFHVYLVVSILQGFMFYAGLITAVIAVVYALILKQKLRPISIRAFAVVVYISIVSLAVFNAYSPVVHRLTVTTDKALDKPMEIALVSDTHLGRWFGNRQIDKMVKLIDAQNPDVVVIAGDVMNDSTDAYEKTNMHEHLSKLRAPLGVYATLGNHDYSGNEVAIAKAIERAGIQVIDNKSVWLDDAVLLVGRSDATDPVRPAAADLLTRVEGKKPVIFLEHSPDALEEIKDLPVDLHLSGHTHGGQIFPLTVLLKWFTPLVYGHEQINGTQFLVTSGYGIGAVPFRLGTRSEIWMITLQST